MPEKTPAAKAAADQYITIPVAEYVYLHKQATMLEMIIKDQTYHRETVAAAVSLWLSMNDQDVAFAGCSPISLSDDQGEAGADL